MREYVVKIPTWLAPILLALVSLLFSAYVGYSNNDKSLSSRITAVETQQKNDREAIQRIENKLDRFYSEWVNRLK